VDCLLKPFSEENLLAAVESAASLSPKPSTTDPTL
jgi:FixJ family two-component response regulator